jgi:uncharacterized caspase-like protein
MAARFWGLAVLLVGVFIAFLQPSMASEPRVALVIGNSNYGPEIGLLKNPGNDAKLMADTLKGLGFQVDLVLDADQKAMKRAVKSFGAKLREAGSEATGLFYYAGHGVQVEGTNYLLPVGAEIAAEADVEIESIAADDVMTQMQSAGNAVNLVFLDACRNNPLARASRSATRGLARLDAPRGSFVGYSTAPGDVAADGDGVNSPYALALAEELKTPGISVEEAHRNVRAKVLAVSGNKQTPWDSSSLTGSVILAAKAAESAPAPAVQPSPASQPQIQQQAVVDKEALFWESIKDSKNPAELEAYVKKYPEGTFVDLARVKIEAMKAQSESPTSAQQTTGSTNAASGSSKLNISQKTWEEIDLYLKNVSSQSGRYWALAVSNDGERTERIGCPKSSGLNFAGCWDGGYSQAVTNRLALRKCGSDCILLYVGNEKTVNVDFEIQ